MPLSDAQRALLQEPHYAIVGTPNADGSVQQTMVWFILEGDEIRFSLGSGSVKARNISRAATATLTVAVGPRYLTVSGPAEIGPYDPDLLLRIATRYIGPERAAAWVANARGPERAAARIRIARVYGQGA